MQKPQEAIVPESQSSIENAKINLSQRLQESIKFVLNGQNVEIVRE